MVALLLGMPHMPQGDFQPQPDTAELRLLDRLLMQYRPDGAMHERIMMGSLTSNAVMVCRTDGSRYSQDLARSYVEWLWLSRMVAAQEVSTSAVEELLRTGPDHAREGVVSSDGIARALWHRHWRDRRSLGMGLVHE